MVSIYSDVLERDGTAVDAAIAAMFCNGVYSPHSLGIGGGFFMTLYIAETGEVITLNSREVAPAAASEDMFHGDTTLSKVGRFALKLPKANMIPGCWFQVLFRLQCLEKSKAIGRQSKDLVTLMSHGRALSSLPLTWPGMALNSLPVPIQA